MRQITHHLIGLFEILRRSAMLACCCVALCCALPAQAAMYRWFDAEGQAHYTTAPPASGVTRLEIKRDGVWQPYDPQAPTPPPRERAVQTPDYQTAPPTTRVEIPYRKQQNIILIEATLNHAHTADYMIDTGASFTVISRAVADRLGLRPLAGAPPLMLHTAGGLIQAPLVNIAAVSIGSVTVPNVMAAIHDVDPAPGIAGVIGLNLLNRFTMTVDAGQHTLVLEPREPLSTYQQRDCAQARLLLNQAEQPTLRPADKIERYRQAIAFCPDLLPAYIALAEVYYQEGQYQDAITQFLTVVRLLPDEPDAHYRLGLLYAANGQYDDARRAFQKVLELDPAHRAAQESLRKLTP